MARDVTGAPRPGMFNSITTECGVVLTPVSGRGTHTKYKRSDTGEIVELRYGTQSEAEYQTCIKDAFPMTRSW